MGSATEQLRMWEPVQSDTLSWRIVEQIRGALFSGQIKSGDFLGSETSLATQFGVSRMASRDALRTLVALGIIEIRMGAKGGAWIAKGNPERSADALAIQLQLMGVDAEEMLSAQMAIEVSGADLAAGRRDAADLEKMELILQELESLKDDPTAFTQKSLEFHEVVVAASGNRILHAQFRALCLVMQPLLVPNTTTEVAKRVLKSHRALLIAIKAGDGEEARRVCLARVKSLRQHFLGEGKPATKPSTSRVRPKQ